MNRDKVVLSINERLILANQYLILEALYPDEAEEYQQKREIVEHGYELEYNDLNATIVESQIPEEVCQNVMDVLDMFRALGDSFKRLDESKREGIDETRLKFDGFDGHDSSGRLWYAKFLVLTQRRWEEALEDRPLFDLDSHSTVNEMYSRMLAVWNELGRKFDLSADEIKQILAARTHPDFR